MKTVSSSEKLVFYGKDTLEISVVKTKCSKINVVKACFLG